jgi:AraC-like DNA-binding protein
MTATMLSRDDHRAAKPPLTSCGRFSTSDPEIAVHEVTKLLAPHHLVLGDNVEQFHARASRAELRGASLDFMKYRSSMTIHCPPQTRYVAAIVPIAGSMAIAYDDSPLREAPCGSLAIVPTDCPVELRFRDNVSILIVSAETDSLIAGLRRIAPQVDADDLWFDGAVASGDGPATTFYGLSEFVAGVVDRYESPAVMPSSVIETLKDQIVSTFLLALSHNRSEMMLRASSPVANRVVRQALDIITNDDNAETSISDIAARLGVSVRSLELGFRKELDRTPRQYLQAFRLQRAHEQLSRARPGDGTTVTDVAIRCGFNHTGRFAKLYKGVYGQPPSVKLRA